MTGDNGKWRSRLLVLLGLGLLPAWAPSAFADAADLCFRGVNLSGAEYGEKGGVYGTDYTYPSEATVKYFAAKGMNSIRLPFKWERLQPLLGNRLNEEELQRLRDAIAMIRAEGMTVILDPHNYAYYDGKQIGTKEVPDFAFADFWARLAVEFANADGIAFGLMNEPHDVSATAWLQATNAAIAAIRAVKADNLILVPGTIWTGAHSWERDIPGGSNATVMLGVKDPASNYAYEVHQYLDSDYSGTHEACDNAGAANTALTQFTAWLRTNNKRGFLGEFGAAANAQCIAGLKQMVDTVAANGDVWLGWTYWAAGEWWSADEPMNIQPTPAGDRKQLPALMSGAEGKSSAGTCILPR